MLGTKEYYDKTAARWAEEGYAEDARLPFLDIFLGLLPPGGRVLDLCCGPGYESGRIRSQGFETVGVDISEACLEIARARNPGISFLNGNLLEDYSVKTGPVDGILLSAGLVHVESRDLPLAFAQMSRALRPGGYVAATVREGVGKMMDRSIEKIDGLTYDRNFIAHTLEELTGAMGNEFSYLRELPSDMAVWRAYLFQKCI